MTSQNIISVNNIDNNNTYNNTNQKETPKMTASTRVLNKLGRVAAKYVPYAVVTEFETPIHEGIHAGLAKLLPGVQSAGVEINSSYWYSKPLDWLSLGFYHSADLPATTGGRALLTGSTGTWVSDLSHAIVAAGPEVLTLTASFALIGNAMKNITKKGKQVYATVQALTANAFIEGAQHYYEVSAKNPFVGSDHANFTKYILDALQLPGDQLVPYATFLFGATFISAGLFMAKPFVKDKSINYQKND